MSPPMNLPTSAVTRRPSDVPGVEEIVLDNRPVNALTMAMRAELVGVAEGLGDDDGVRAVILRGEGRGFSAGSDVREFPATEDEGRERAHAEHACVEAVERLPMPALAALHGHVLGGGLELALGCDLRIAEESARIGLPEVNLGLFPSGGGATRLARLVGAARAKELMFTGTVLSAAEAHALGIVDHVVPEGAAADRALELAGTIAARPARAVRAIKRVVTATHEDTDRAGLATEAELIAELFTTDDAREGVAAFLAKRAPEFRHH